MKVWIDFINSPQVTFFVPLIRDMENEGHDLILTCRDSGNTIDLLTLHSLDYIVAGRSVGKGIFKKLSIFPRRLFELLLIIRKLKPDLAASQSSFYQPIIARFLRIPCFYTNDNEHAKGNVFGFLFASRVALPGVLAEENFTKKRWLKSKLYFYPGVKEAVYLSQRTELLGLNNHNRTTIYFRPEPWTAQYYKAGINFFDETISNLSEEHPITVLPRDQKQRQYYKQDKFKTIMVAEKPISLESIVSDCLVFIGAGGSMTRELAVLGTPVVSIYQDKLLRVDQYLINRGMMMVNPRFSLTDLKDLIGSESSHESKQAIINDGAGAYKLIKELILNTT